MSELSIAHVDQANALLAEAKSDKASGAISDEQYRAIKRDVVETRLAYKQQEVAAGRRNGFVGGDAQEIN